MLNEFSLVCLCVFMGGWVGGCITCIKPFNSLNIPPNRYNFDINFIEMKISNLLKVLQNW